MTGIGLTPKQADRPTAVVGHMPFPHRNLAQIRADASLRSGTVARPPRNTAPPPKPKPAKCSACAEFRAGPCEWPLCPKQREAA